MFYFYYLGRNNVAQKIIIIFIELILFKLAKSLGFYRKSKTNENFLI